jgi:hypothetical protein
LTGANLRQALLSYREDFTNEQGIMEKSMDKHNKQNKNKAKGLNKSKPSQASTSIPEEPIASTTEDATTLKRKPKSPVGKHK